MGNIKIGISGCLGRMGQEISKQILKNNDTNFISLQAHDEIRISEGIPRFGVDYSNENFPQEVGLGDHISYEKGCYIGQEVVARLNTYDKVQKKLVKLEWQGDLEQNEITCDHKPVGVITSAENGIGLGFVRNIYAELEKELDCGERKIVVTEILAE